MIAQNVRVGYTVTTPSGVSHLVVARTVRSRKITFYFDDDTCDRYAPTEPIVGTVTAPVARYGALVPTS